VPRQPVDRVAVLHAIRDSIPGNSSKAQQERLLRAIQRLGSVTTFEASRHLDLYDCRARKMDLVKAGHPIQKSWDQVHTEAGVPHRVGRYFLARSRGASA
jgi:hypothetical protein